jgi:HPt (histidine-containing phosphotransfer) domain-containing protein
MIGLSFCIFFGGMAVSDVLDKSAVLAHFGGDAELVRDIAGLFEQSSRDVLAQIHSALARADAEQVRRAAHTMKGSAANFLAKPVSDAAYRLEQLARAGDLTAAPAALSILETQVERLRTALAEWNRELDPDPVNRK